MTGYGSGLYGSGLYGGSVGVPYLLNSLGPDATLAVEIAFGADLTADAATWPWTDVTEDVRTDQGIETNLGRNDEASTTQPASCSFTLDNTSGDYSLGGESALYPNVRRNTPVRISVLNKVVFQGFADGFTPTWNLTGTTREVTVSASGVLRRLIQGSSPLVSSMRRGLTDQPDTVAYWPCEEQKNATRIQPVVGSQEMTFTGSPKFADNSGFDSSAPIITLNGATLTGDVDPYPDTGKSQVRMMLTFPASPDVDSGPVPLFRVYTTGSIAYWEVYYDGSNGAVQLFAADRFINLIDTSSLYNFGLNGSNRFFSFEMTQDGADVDWRLGTLSPYVVLGSAQETIPGQTFGIVTRVVVDPDSYFVNSAVGHIIVQNDVTSRFATQKQLDANNGEFAFQRINRLCSENGIPVTVFGDGIGGQGVVDGMGPQPISDVVTLLRECETVDQGVLFDGVAAGLTMRTRYARENRTADLTISAADAKLAVGFGPIDDDQRNRNRVEAKRSSGSSATYEDSDGPLGTETIGIYDSSITVNSDNDNAMLQYASWLVALGTVTGYRYPSVSVDLRASPELASAWLNVRPGSRIDVTGIRDVLPGHPEPTVSLLVEGVSNSFTGGTWTGTAKCSLYEPYRTAVVATETGDTGEYQFRLLSDGSTLVAGVSAGATSLSVSTPSGPLWTTSADDFPFVIEVGGVTATVTNISGASSPQTFTVTGLEYNKSAGAEVTLHRPNRLGL